MQFSVTELDMQVIPIGYSLKISQGRVRFQGLIINLYCSKCLSGCHSSTQKPWKHRTDTKCQNGLEMAWAVLYDVSLFGNVICYGPGCLCAALMCLYGLLMLFFDLCRPIQMPMRCMGLIGSQNPKSIIYEDILTSNQFLNLLI